MFSQSAQEQILFDKIYQYLWIKSDTSSPPATLIPETVIIVRSQPIFWYYSDKETGEIRKKKREGVQKHIIKSNWLEKTGKCGVVAYLLHFCEDLDLKSKKQSTREPKQTSQIQIIYLDEFDFVEFMDNTTVQIPFGIIQKFIQSGDTHNSQIQATWSKKITLFSKRTNKKMLDNRKMNIYERCCTFEGPEYFSEASQVKDFQSQRIADQINKMIYHLDEISYGKLNILQGTFYFKVDKSARCWFLFCGNLRFQGDSGTTLSHIQLDQIEIPKTIDNIISVYSQHPVKLEKSLICLNCDKRDKSSNFMYIPYNYLIENKDQRGVITKPQNWPEELKEDAQMVKLSTKNVVDVTKQSNQFLNTINQMPIIFERLHYRLNQESYEKLKDEFQFQNKQIRVCFECYFNLVGLQDQLGLVKVQDNLDYLEFMTRQKAKPSFNIPNRIQFLNCRKLQAETQQLRRQQKEQKQFQSTSSQFAVEKPIQQYIDKKFSEQALRNTFLVEKPANSILAKKTSTMLRQSGGKSLSLYKSSEVIISTSATPIVNSRATQREFSQFSEQTLQKMIDKGPHKYLSQFNSAEQRGVQSPPNESQAYNLCGTDLNAIRSSRSNPYELHSQQILQGRTKKKQTK